jgi:hypothetical protein
VALLVDPLVQTGLYLIFTLILDASALCNLQPFVEHLPSDLQLIDAVGTPEYPHQHFMRVDEETDRTALGGSKHCSEQPLHLHNYFLSAGK